ncbi:MAG: RNA-guided pseudouridylation complex pseudouridine synthase subunit Cbf5 [Thermoplasmata archaeon]|nr:MAG: RNA-guided pseudouridylation complex pseudouridine synthase subunit Cbf5 [Thermoplasmata archaeon]
MLPQERIQRKRLIKSKALTTSKLGMAPKDRSLDELLKSGIVVLDKPSGPTSHQVSAWVRDILDVEKVGHGGTLDPRVTGLLPITLNTATNAVRTLLIGGKEYVGIMQFHSDIPQKKVKEIFKEFTGKIYQMPPVRSAVKREMRIREIYYLELLEMEKRRVLFRVGCEAGTYVRTLCHDIGDALGIGAHMLELRRTKFASFTEGDAVTLHDIKDAFIYWKENNDESYLRKAVLPLERLLGHIPKIVVKDSAVDAICHGADLALPGVLQLDSEIKLDDMVALITSKGEGIALGNAQLTSEDIFEKEEGIAVNTKRVLMPPGTYPKLWGSR